jgi:hypothetical protein
MNAIGAHLQEFQVASVTGTSFPLIHQMNLTDLKRGKPAQNTRAIDFDEQLIDERDSFRPSEFVQRKLQLALHSCPLPVSCMHSERLVRRPR